MSPAWQNMLNHGQGFPRSRGDEPIKAYSLL